MRTTRITRKARRVDSGGRLGHDCDDSRGGESGGLGRAVADVRHDCVVLLPRGLGHSQLRGLHGGPTGAMLFLSTAEAAGKVPETVKIGTWPETVGQGGKPCDDLLQALNDG